MKRTSDNVQEKQVTKMTTKIDHLIARLGDPGRFQLLLSLFLGLNMFPIFFNNIVNTFYLLQTPYRCKSTIAAEMAMTYNTNYSSTSISDDGGGGDGTGGGGGGGSLTLNSTGTKYMNLITPSEEYGDECLLKVINESTGANYSTTCDVGWKFEPVDNEWTIIAEWDLICNRSYMSSLVVTIYFLGVMVGGLLFGFLADKFGRKPVMLICLYIPIVLGTIAAHVQHYEIFSVLRFLTGICIQGLQTTTFVMTMELYLTKYRARAGIFVAVVIGTVVMTLAGLGYLLRNWRHLQMAISLPSLLAIPYIFIIPESLRWLLLRGRFPEAELVAKRMSIANSLEFPKELFDRVKEEMSADDPAQMTRQYGFTDIFSKPNIRKISIIMFLLWFTAALGYYGISLKISNLVGNKYLNLFVGGLLEFIVYLVLFCMIARLPRKFIVTGCLIIGGACCITAQLIPTIQNILSSVFFIIGRCAYAGLMSTLFVYTSELFPTVVRNIGLGTCLVWGRIGGILSPQISLLHKYVHPLMPFLCLGALSFITGGLSLLLPETKDSKFPDNIDDLDMSKPVYNIPVIIVDEPQDTPFQNSTIVNGTGTTNGTTTAILPPDVTFEDTTAVTEESKLNS
ncbi:organic cation transporter protein-like [Octopus vulgaris]|uniref:Organic cation transporter protein-like n=2 Tax=Octopus TaxID=6643 RepID=A0AA36AZZ9_OCTVU|nr:organic cation transporter protein-like [Octopus vulgaris]